MTVSEATDRLVYHGREGDDHEGLRPTRRAQDEGQAREPDHGRDQVEAEDDVSQKVTKSS